jgi:predicted ArsR family transcriptional regulator
MMGAFVPPPLNTRKEAHEEAGKRKKYVRTRVLGALSDAALTADEIAQQINESVLTVRPCVTELGNEGVLIKTALRRQNKSGRKAIVWMTRG